MRNKTVALISGAQPTSVYDVWKGYGHALRMLGFNVVEIPYHLLFKQWNEYSRFFGVVRGDKNFTFDSKSVLSSASLNLVLEVLASNPDYVVVIDGVNIHKSAWEWFNRLGFPPYVVSTECPYQDKTIGMLREYAKVIFANDLYSSKALDMLYLPTGYNSNINYPIAVPESVQHDVVFVGSGFPERIKFLEGVDWTDIDFEFFGHYPIAQDSYLAKYYKDAQIPNELATVYYNGARINLNLNRTSFDYTSESYINVAKSLSPRAYEIAACGGFMLSEYREELDVLFGELVPTFTTPEQLNALIHYWLAPERKKDRISMGEELKDMVKGHSYIDRAKVLVSYFE